MSNCFTDIAYNSDLQESENAIINSLKSIKMSDVKLLPFLEDDPDLWFALADNTFNVYGIKEDTHKYSLILKNLDLKYKRMIRDEILKESNDYNSLKKEIVKQLREEMTKKLESEVIGERTPQEFLQHLKSMAGLLVPESTLQIIWRERLPSAVKAIVQLDPSVSLAQKVETAELVNETIAALAKEKMRNKTLEETLKKVDSMAEEINQLKWRIGML